MCAQSRSSVLERSDFSHSTFIAAVEFVKVNDNNQIFRKDFICIQYHLCKVSAYIIECIIFAPFELSTSNKYLLYRDTMSYFFVLLHFFLFPCAFCFPPLANGNSKNKIKKQRRRQQERVHEHGKKCIYRWHEIKNSRRL